MLDLMTENYMERIKKKTMAAIAALLGLGFVLHQWARKGSTTKNVGISLIAAGVALLVISLVAASGIGEATPTT